MGNREAKFNLFIILQKHEGDYRGRPGFSRLGGNPDDFAKVLSISWNGGRTETFLSAKPEV